MSFKSKESGFTLIEVLATVIILTTGFMILIGFFTQSLKTNTYSAETLDTTYLAQNEMENIYALISNQPLNKIGQEIKEFNYTQVEDFQDWNVYIKPVEDTPYFLKLRIKEYDEEAQLLSVIISVEDNENKKELVKMENKIKWK